MILVFAVPTEHGVLRVQGRQFEVTADDRAADLAVVGVSPERVRLEVAVPEPLVDRRFHFHYRLAGTLPNQRLPQPGEIGPNQHWINYDKVQDRKAKENRVPASFHPPHITELMRPERIAAIPKGINRHVPEPRGHKGVCVGRENELKQIAGYFHSQYENEAEGLLHEDDCIACILMNAPGGGKTTLREEYIRQVAKVDTVAIELTTGELMHPAAFSEAIIRYGITAPRAEPPEDAANAKPQRDRLTKLLRTVKGVPGIIATRAVGVMAESYTLGSGPYAATATAAVLQMKNNLTEQLANEIETTGAMIPPDRALELLSETHNGNYLLTVDEFHVLGNDRLDINSMQELLSIVCNPTIRKTRNIRGGGLLISGLGNVKDNLDSLGLSRAEVVWMTGLSRADAEYTIRKSLEELPEIILAGERRVKIVAEWPHRLADTFSRWPQHVGLAARAAKRVLQQSAQMSEATDAERLEWVMTATADKVVMLYTSQLHDAQRDADPHAPTVLAAMAELSDGFMPTKAVLHAVERCRESRGLSGEPSAVKQTMALLKRHGIIRDRRIRPPEGAIVAGYGTGVSSIADYTLKMASESERKDAYEWARWALAESQKLPTPEK